MTSLSCLPTELYQCQQTRELDKLAAKEEGIAGIILMKRAGLSAYQKIVDRYGASPLIVLCGAGNNAGDGYVIAALAAQKKHDVTVLFLSDPQKLKGDAATAYRYAVQEEVDIHAYSEEKLARPNNGSVIIDAMLGTGFSPPLRQNYCLAIQQINALKQKVFSLDIPSGLNADTGSAEVAVAADATITFIALKPGLITAEGPDYVGELYFDDLSVPQSIYKKLSPSAKRLDINAVDALKLKRSPASHKGSHGKVLVCGGDKGMGGAAILAAEAALYSGAGLTALATRACHVTAALVRVPEVMTFAVDNASQIELRSPFDCLVVGPGLGQSAWSEQILYAALQFDCPCVIDADALNMLANYGLEHFSNKPKNWVLTPHPGEAARLLGVAIKDVQNNRLQAAQELQAKFGGIVILKGAGTIIAGDSEVFIANVGNPGLASGGMGDILSGVIGALLAQGLTCELAAKLAVCVHGEAAEVYRQQSEGVIGVRASDLLPVVRQLLN